MQPLLLLQYHLINLLGFYPELTCLSFYCQQAQKNRYQRQILQNSYQIHHHLTTKKMNMRNHNLIQFIISQEFLLWFSILDYTDCVLHLFTYLFNDSVLEPNDISHYHHNH